MPRISKPFAPYWSLRSTNSGISALHGPHQVAQKLMRTTFPLKSAIFTDLPCMSFKVKLRLAAVALGPHEEVDGAWPAPPPSPPRERSEPTPGTQVSVTTAATAAAPATIHFIFINLSVPRFAPKAGGRRPSSTDYRSWSWKYAATRATSRSV